MFTIAAVTSERVCYLDAAPAISTLKIRCRDAFLDELGIHSEAEFLESGIESSIVPKKYRQGYSAFLQCLADWQTPYSFMLTSDASESDGTSSLTGAAGFRSARSVKLMANAGMQSLSDGECLLVRLMSEKRTLHVPLSDRLWLAEELEALHKLGLLTGNLEQMTTHVLAAREAVAVAVGNNLTVADRQARESGRPIDLIRWLTDEYQVLRPRDPIIEPNDEEGDCYGNSCLTGAEAYKVLTRCADFQTLITRRSVRNKYSTACSVQDILYYATMSRPAAATTRS